MLKLLPEDSWFHDWMTLWPVSEPPLSFILFAAMGVMGGAIGRRAWLSMDVHTLYPLLNLLLIGPSGCGKSTALRDIAIANLITPLPDGPLKPMVLTGRATKEALHQDLMAQPHSIIMISELANFFSKEKYMEGAISYVTDLLDLAPARVRTKGGGNLIVERPECSILGCSTREWLQGMLPDSAGEGGFLPRFLILKEDYKYQRISNPNALLSEAQKKSLASRRDKSLQDFNHIVSAASGQFDFTDYEASDFYDFWYQTYLPESGALAPFAARAGAHVLRLSLLVAISRFASSISIGDLRAGIGLHAYTQRRLAEVVVPMSASGKLMSKLLDAIGGEWRTAIDLRRAMRNHCGGQDVDRMLTDLERNKEIIYDDREGDRFFKRVR